MNIGVVGLGKLGMPVAAAIAYKGHTVRGYDVNPERMKRHHGQRELGPRGELSIEPMLQDPQLPLQFCELEELVRESNIVFVAVQTPHEPLFEGISRMPMAKADFNYDYLKGAMAKISAVVDKLQTPKVVAVISTVLPGTSRREILPNINPLIQFCYNPFFIAMGTTVYDFLHPEFVLFGTDHHNSIATNTVKQFYATIHGKAFCEMTIENAELTKVAYNTFITMKICFANTLMEICHKTPGCDVDEVTDTLALATDRLISPKYMTAGMGDGGGCHPRDNIAMSWLARQLGLAYNWFDNLMLCREQQTDWIARLAEAKRVQYNLPKDVCIYGKAFKPGTNLTVGSPAMLLRTMFIEKGYHITQLDPYVDDKPTKMPQEKLIVIATKHDVFPCMAWPQGSIVIDPFRYIPFQLGVDVVHVGINQA